VTAEVAVDGTDFNAFRKKYHCEISQRLAKLQAREPLNSLPNMAHWCH
jgi:hypothetical protein